MLAVQVNDRVDGDVYFKRFAFADALMVLLGAIIGIATRIMVYRYSQSTSPRRGNCIDLSKFFWTAPDFLVQLANITRNAVWRVHEYSDPHNTGSGSAGGPSGTLFISRLSVCLFVCVCVCVCCTCAWLSL